MLACVFTWWKCPCWDSENPMPGFWLQEFIQIQSDCCWCFSNMSMMLRFPSLSVMRYILGQWPGCWHWFHWDHIEFVVSKRYCIGYGKLLTSRYHDFSFLLERCSKQSYHKWDRCFASFVEPSFFNEPFLLNFANPQSPFLQSFRIQNRLDPNGWKGKKNESANLSSFIYKIHCKLNILI